KLKSDDKKNVILRVKDGEKVITNVADGVKAKDAVNVSQLNDIKSKLQNDIKEVDKKSDLALGGVSNAVAMANLPQVMGDKKFNLAASYGYYGGSHAVAIGFSGTNDNQNFIYKLSGSVNSKGNLAFGIGAGVMLGSVNSKDKRISDLETRLKEQTEKTNRLEKQLEKVMKRLGQN
ncbi:YadA-like family protein, partial [Sneathia sp. DSM 16630]|nr:YadA-like family protein [Sneathia sp. DSM 16630]